MLSTLCQLIVTDTRATQRQSAQRHCLAGSYIRIDKRSRGHDAQRVALDDAAIHNLVIDQRCSCRAVIDLVLGSDAADSDGFLRNGSRHRFCLCVRMVAVALYLIIDGIRPCRCSCWQGRLIGTSVKAVEHRATFGVTRRNERLRCAGIG